MLPTTDSWYWEYLETDLKKRRELGAPLRTLPDACGPRWEGKGQPFLGGSCPVVTSSSGLPAVRAKELTPMKLGGQSSAP